jgi:hypothetical protein
VCESLRLAFFEVFPTWSSSRALKRVVDSSEMFSIVSALVKHKNGGVTFIKSDRRHHGIRHISSIFPIIPAHHISISLHSTYLYAPPHLLSVFQPTYYIEDCPKGDNYSH